MVAASTRAAAAAAAQRTAWVAYLYLITANRLVRFCRGGRMILGSSERLLVIIAVCLLALVVAAINL